MNYVCWICVCEREYNPETAHWNSPKLKHFIPINKKNTYQNEIHILVPSHLFYLINLLLIFHFLLWWIILCCLLLSPILLNYLWLTFYFLRLRFSFISWTTKFARPQPPSCCVGLAELLVRLYFRTQGFKDVKESIHQETADVRGRKVNQAVPGSKWRIMCTLTNMVEK